MRSNLLFAFLTLGIAGCGGSETVVSGTVSVSKQPVERGYITFFPVECTKATRGVEIKEGRFTATDIPPGQWRVQVTEAPDVEAVKQKDGSTLLKMRAAKRRNSSKANAKPLVVEIRPGSQTLDLTL